MVGDDVMTSGIEKFNNTYFEYWMKQIEDYFHGKKLYLSILGKRPEKMDSLSGNQTWELTELPSRKKTLHNQWVYQVKTELDDSKRYKTKLFEKNFQQRQDIAHTVGVVSKNMSNQGKSLEEQGYVDADISTKGVTLEKLKLCSSSASLLA